MIFLLISNVCFGRDRFAMNVQTRERAVRLKGAEDI